MRLTVTTKTIYYCTTEGGESYRRIDGTWERQVAEDAWEREDYDDQQLEAAFKEWRNFEVIEIGGQKFGVPKVYGKTPDIEKRRSGQTIVALRGLNPDQVAELKDCIGQIVAVQGETLRLAGVGPGETWGVTQDFQTKSVEVTMLLFAPV